MERSTQPHVVIVTSQHALIEQSGQDQGGFASDYRRDRNLTAFDRKRSEVGGSVGGAAIHEFLHLRGIPRGKAIAINQSQVRICLEKPHLGGKVMGEPDVV